MLLRLKAPNRDYSIALAESRGIRYPVVLEQELQLHGQEFYHELW